MTRQKRSRRCRLERSKPEEDRSTVASSASRLLRKSRNSASRLSATGPTLQKAAADQAQCAEDLGEPSTIQGVSGNEYTGPDQHEQHRLPDSCTPRMPRGGGNSDRDGNPEAYGMNALRERKPETHGGQERRPERDASRTEGADEQRQQSRGDGSVAGAARELNQDRAVRRTIAVQMSEF